MFSVGPLDILVAGLLALRRYGLGPTMLGALGLAIAVQPLLPPVPCDGSAQPLFRRCQPPTSRYEALMRTDLRNLASQQEIHFADHGTYTADPERLAFLTSGGVIVHVVADGDGWAARATHSALPDTEGCAIRWGDVPADLIDVGVEAPPYRIVCST